MARDVVVSVLGPDRPGIVAAMSRVVFDLGCNFEQVGSTIIGGHFAMTMLARCGDHVLPATIEEKVGAAAAELDLQVAVKVADGSGAGAPTHAVTVTGADKPGIVYRVADTLARMDVNIVSLDLRTEGAGGDRTCALEVVVQSPPGTDLENTLPPLQEELGTDVHVRRA